MRITAADSLIIRYIRERIPENSVVFLVGIGKCYPILRSHTILNNLHQVVDHVPVVMFYPGKYDGQELVLFGEIKDDNYYRRFSWSNHTEGEEVNDHQRCFLKSIERDIKGVIKVGQDDTANMRQELSEYVVTRELQRHFMDFFSAYKKGIVGHTDKMGVWISGFFGSGKSHFLKILSYLLSDREVDGKKALQYFIDEDKIKDSMVLADMKLASDTPADVILFNIDSKGEASGKQNKDAIVSVFFKVFNEMQGFCGAIPFLADLERKLTEDGRYEEFALSFEEINGSPWREARNEFDFIQDDVVETLAKIGFMSEEAGRNWCEKTTEPYSISIERFAGLVRSYIERRGTTIMWCS